MFLCSRKMAVCAPWKGSLCFYQDSKSETEVYTSYGIFFCSPSFLTLHSFDRPLPDIESYASINFRSANVGFQTFFGGDAAICRHFMKRWLMQNMERGRARERALEGSRCGQMRKRIMGSPKIHHLAGLMHSLAIICRTFPLQYLSSITSAIHSSRI